MPPRSQTAVIEIRDIAASAERAMVTWHCCSMNRSDGKCKLPAYLVRMSTVAECTSESRMLLAKEHRNHCSEILRNIRAFKTTTRSSEAPVTLSD